MAAPNLNRGKVPPQGLKWAKYELLTRYILDTATFWNFGGFGEFFPGGVFVVQYSTKRYGATVRGTVKPRKDAAIAQQRALKSGVIKGVKLYV